MRIFIPYLPVDTSRPVNQVAEFSSLVFGLKEKGQFSACRSSTLCNMISIGNREERKRKYHHHRARNDATHTVYVSYEMNLSCVQPLHMSLISGEQCVFEEVCFPTGGRRRGGARLYRYVAKAQDEVMHLFRLARPRDASLF